MLEGESVLEKFTLKRSGEPEDERILFTRTPRQ